MIFPYVRYQVEESSAIPSGEISRPEIPIRVIGPKAVVKADGLIDTGADQYWTRAIQRARNPLVVTN
jgi:hypothetical protein